MISRRALIDTNVIIAAVDPDHPHHPPSAVLLTEAPGRLLAVAAHSYAEAFSTLTRLNAASPFKWRPERARAALSSVAAFTILVGLSPSQSLEATMAYADSGNIGPRIFDRLIGCSAEYVGIDIIITWNIRHISRLFPQLEILTPDQAIA